MLQGGSYACEVYILNGHTATKMTGLLK